MPGLGSLQGTMIGPPDPNDLIAQLLQSMQANAAQASQGATQAGNAYTQATQAPPPQTNPLGDLVGGLGADVASILSGNKGYQEEHTQRQQLSQKQLFENRQNTLQSLRDKYLAQSEAAQKLGNEAAHTEALVALNKVENSQSQLMKAQEQQAEKERTDATLKGAMDRQKLGGKQNLDEIAARGVQDRLTEAQKLRDKPKMSSSERAAQVRQGIDPETGMMLSTVANREVTRRLALAKRGDEKTRNEALSGAIDIASQRWHTDKTPRDMAARLLKLRHPFYKETAKDARYALTGEKIYRKVGKQWVEDDAHAAQAVQRAKELTTPWFQE